MDAFIGRIVRSAAGHDSGQLYCVVGLDEERERLLLANGKQRKASAPKAKKLKHVQILDQGTFEHPVIGKLKEGSPVSDRAMRAALAAFKEGITLG